MKRVHDKDEIGLLLFLAPQDRPVERSQVEVRVLKALLEMRHMEAGEITDKGYIHQRAVQQRRAADVATLYSTTPDRCVVAL